jgi:glycerophosphoryl diester phosphodiesterase
LVIAWLAIGADVELIDHRGESADAPENTMAAFNLAWERKATAIELDVHLTRDGVLIVSHDANTERTAGVSKVIKESTLSELRTLDVGRWKDPKWAGEQMPTLVEALKTIPEHARCFIEVKVGPEAVPALVDVVRDSGKRAEQLVVISFHADTIAEVKRRLPQLKAYFLAGFRQNPETKAWSPTVDELIRQAKEIDADGLDLASKGPVDRQFVDRVKAAGLEFYIWTVDDPKEAVRFIEAGVDGITTNRAYRMKSDLAQARPARATGGTDR